MDILADAVCAGRGEVNTQQDGKGGVKFSQTEEKWVSLRSVISTLGARFQTFSSTGQSAGPKCLVMSSKVCPA